MQGVETLVDVASRGPRDTGASLCADDEDMINVRGSSRIQLGLFYNFFLFSFSGFFASFLFGLSLRCCFLCSQAMH